MSLDEDTLAAVAQNGEIDYAKWPAIIEPLLQRLNRIVHNDFPLPRPYSTLTSMLSSSSDTALQQSSTQTGSTLVSQTPTTPRTLPPVPPFPGSASSTSQVANSQPEPSQTAQANENEDISTPELPLALAQLLVSITNTLRNSFSNKPPHTVQRLAELILYPNNHYRTLPSYLRALDRVVSVSSTADIFPLSDQPALVNGVTNGEAGGILWKNDTNGHDKTRESDLGSDESLGGALLTPIPWLRDVHRSEKGDSQSSGLGVDIEQDLLAPLASSDPSIANTNSDADTTSSPTDSSTSSHAATALAIPQQDPLVPERQDGAVTQGELIRMEQEAGVVPVTHSSQSAPIRSVGRNEPMSSSIALGVGVGLDDFDDDDDSIGEGAPHARGPDIVGTVDMGLVGGRDVQVRIGSPPDEDSREHGTAVDPNDAQDVLGGLGPAEAIRRHGDESGTASDADYVDVGTEMSDEMQIDSIEELKEKTTSAASIASEDDDIVLVDADGTMETEREKIDEVGGQAGNDAGDTTR